MAVQSPQHDPDSKGKEQGVIQSGENRVLLFIFAFPFFNTAKSENVSPQPERRRL